MIIESYGRDHLAGQGDGELDHVRRPTAGQHLDRFRDLQGVSGSESQGTDMSVSSATVVTPSARPRSTMVCASSRADSWVFMNAPEPTLTSSTRPRYRPRSSCS